MLLGILLLAMMLYASFAFEQLLPRDPYIELPKIHHVLVVRFDPLSSCSSCLLMARRWSTTITMFMTGTQIEYYCLTYSRHMHPIREEDVVEGWSDCEAPQLTKKRGQPKNIRHRTEEKSRRQVVCSHCGRQGHNRRGYRNAAQS